MLEFNGKWIKTGWTGWSEFEISPEGLRTHQGTISIGAIRLAIWRLNGRCPGRAYFMMTDNNGEEVRVPLA